MTKKNKETKSTVVSLEVYDLDENVFLQLPTVFTMPLMPVTQDDIPKQADVDRWPNLNGIRLEHINAEVGLLIDSDNYAVRTQFGWALNGPLCRHQSNDARRLSNFIKTDVGLTEQFERFTKLTAS